MIISVFITETSSPFTFKAPKGTMYKIWDVHSTIFAGGANAIGVLNFLSELIEDVWNVDDTGGLIAVFDTAITGSTQDFQFTTGEKSKFITIAKDGSSAFAASIIIHYELISASKTELIIEWFRKGR